MERISLRIFMRLVMAVLLASALMQMGHAALVLSVTTCGLYHVLSTIMSGQYSCPRSFSMRCGGGIWTQQRPRTFLF